MSGPISILLAPNELHRGQSVQVRVVLQLDNPLRVRGLHARFHGAEETKATYVTTTSTGKQVTVTTHTAVEHVTITDESYLLAGREPAGFFANLVDACSTMFGGGRNLMLPVGEHEYLLDISIPDDAPPTHKGNRSRVFYELSVRIDIPMGRDITALRSFDVAALRREHTASPVRVRYPDDEGRGFWDNLLGPDVRIELSLAADTLAAGETIDGVFEAESEEKIEVRAIRARLVGIESSKAHGHRDRYRYQSEPVEIARPGSLWGTLTEPFSISAESIRAMPVSAEGVLFSIDWFVEIELDVPWAKDPSIRAPIRLLPGLG